MATIVAPVFSAGYAVAVTCNLAGLMYQIMAALMSISIASVLYVICNSHLRNNLPDYKTEKEVYSSQHIDDSNQALLDDTTGMASDEYNIGGRT